MEEAAGGVKVLSEKTGSDDNFQNDNKWIGIHDLQIRFDSTSVLNIELWPAIRTGNNFRYEEKNRGVYI